MSGVYVFVRLGDESYALSVEHVREVLAGADITPLPGAGQHVLGLLNLRGDVVPVFDLAALLGASARARSERICVATCAQGVGGLAVGEVTDVAELAGEGDSVDAPLLAGTALVDGRLVGVVDVRAVFAELERRGGT